MCFRIKQSHLLLTISCNSSLTLSTPPFSKPLPRGKKTEKGEVRRIGLHAPTIVHFCFLTTAAEVTDHASSRIPLLNTLYSFAAVIALFKEFYLHYGCRFFHIPFAWRRHGTALQFQFFHRQILQIFSSDLHCIFITDNLHLEFLYLDEYLFRMFDSRSSR